MSKIEFRIMFIVVAILALLVVLQPLIRADSKPTFYCNGSDGIYLNGKNFNVQTFDPNCCKPNGDDCDNG